MAMRSLAKRYISKPEIVLDKLPRFAEHKTFEKSFKEYLSEIQKKKNINSREMEVLFDYPLRKFRKFPKSTVDNLIKSSYDVLMTNNSIREPEIYNRMIRSYLVHNIDCDVSVFLGDMKNNNVPMDNNTFMLLICLYSYRGDMASVQNVVNITKSKGIPLTERAKSEIYGGYIRARQFEEGLKFIEEEHLNENDINLLIKKVEACADIGDFLLVTETMKKIGEFDPSIPGKISGKIYQYLVKSNASESVLDEMISVVTMTNNDVNTSNLIMDLNREGFFRHSWKLFDTFGDNFNRFTLTDVVMSYNSFDCPINIFKSVIGKFSHRIDRGIELLSNMNYGQAYKLVSEIMTEKNSSVLIQSLLKIAAKEKNVENIENSLNLSFNKLNDRANLKIEFVLIDILIESGIVSTAEGILAILPHHKSIILPSVLMHYLCIGNFKGCQSVWDNEKRTVPLNYVNYSRALPKKILENVPFSEIDVFASEASKMFQPNYVNWLVGSIILEKFIDVSYSGDLNRLTQVITVAKSFGVVYGPYDMRHVMKMAPRHRYLLMDFQRQSTDVEKNEVEEPSVVAQDSLLH